jgi:hypothetical protein
MKIKEIKNLSVVESHANTKSRLYHIAATKQIYNIGL